LARVLLLKLMDNHLHRSLAKISPPAFYHPRNMRGQITSGTGAAWIAVEGQIYTDRFGDGFYDYETRSKQGNRPAFPTS
jgi:hypothetical protein